MMQTIWSLSGILSPGIAATIIALPALLRQSGASGPIAQLPDGTLAGHDHRLGLVFLRVVALHLLDRFPRRTAPICTTPRDAPRRVCGPMFKKARATSGIDGPMLWLLGTFTVVNLLSSPVGVFQRLLLKFNLAADWTARGMTFEAALALLATIGSVGGLVGGLFISTWGGLKKKRVYGVMVPDHDQRRRP